MNDVREVEVQGRRAVKSKATVAADWIIVFVCLIFILICLLPFVNLLARSLSSPMAIINRQVSFWPVEFSTVAYERVFKDAAFSRSLWWTGLLTVGCVLLSMTMSIFCAYPLTYDKLKGGKVINTLIILTMYFSAGTIPNYILLQNLNMIDTPLALILPNCISVFNVIILRSFFFGIPESLRESAELDGANPFTVLIRIYLPLSTSVLATLSLFYAVGRWNGFSDALMYISNPKYAPIQLKLYQVINNLSAIEDPGNSQIQNAGEAVKAASVMFATVPIVLIYPWLQRYFISGVTIGAVKG